MFRLLSTSFTLKNSGLVNRKRFSLAKNVAKLLPFSELESKSI